MARNSRFYGDEMRHLKGAGSLSNLGANLFVTALPLFLAILLLTGCDTLGYYAQTVQGQFDLLDRRRAVRELLSDPSLEAGLKQRLVLVMAIRDFASDELGLPDNASYRNYAELDREAMVWNVVATPEFSLEPKRWCYPIIGCASYRGYFSRASAQAYATTLRAQELDVVVQPIPAYSTLGWFDDPVPSTVINWPDARLAAIMFHELAHQQLYIKDDSAFNEAFASAVARVGVKRWLQLQHKHQAGEAWRLSGARKQQFVRLLLSTRERLQTLYQTDLDRNAMRLLKAAEFHALRRRYAALKAKWSGANDFDSWFELAPLNNARLASIATYYDLLPAFLLLLERNGGDLTAFYRECRRLGKLPHKLRHAYLLAIVSESSQ